MLKTLTIADKILILFTFVAALSSFSAIAALAPKGSVVVVEVEGIPVHRAMLSQDSEFSVRGTNGELVLEVKDGEISVVRAECPNRICIRTGSRSWSGDLIVCVPNKVIVRIGANRVGGITG